MTTLWVFRLTSFCTAPLWVVGEEVSQPLQPGDSPRTTKQTKISIHRLFIDWIKSTASKGICWWPKWSWRCRFHSTLVGIYHYMAKRKLKHILEVSNTILYPLCNWNAQESVVCVYMSQWQSLCNRHLSNRLRKYLIFIIWTLRVSLSRVCHCV